MVDPDRWRPTIASHILPWLLRDLFVCVIYFLQAEVFQELENENSNCCQPENMKI